MLTQWGIGVLLQGLRGHVRAVVLEQPYVCKDHKNLFSHFYSKKFRPCESNCSRLHFFSTSIGSIEHFLSHPNDYDAGYLGFSVIRPIPERCLGRTVIDPHKIGLGINNGVYCLRTGFKTHIAGNVFSAQGYPYMSQDTDATVCAHSALWGVCRYLSERYSDYREIYPYDLVLMTGNADGRKVPYRGMTYTDYSKILSEFGCHPLIMRVKKKLDQLKCDPESFKMLYTYVESGFPVLASFQGHVVTLIGHTMVYKYDSSNVDDEGFLDSSVFLKQFVVVDDNFFPYRFLGYEADAENYGNKYGPPSIPGGEPYTINSIVAAVCPLPEKAYMSAPIARKQASEYVKKPKVSELIKKTGAGPYVTRLFLTSGPAFKRRKLKSALSREGAVTDTISFNLQTLALPHFIWVMEVSPLEQYKKGFATAEFVLDATAGKKENGLIYARIGKTIFIDEKQKDEENTDSRFRIYTHNLGEVES